MVNRELNNLGLLSFSFHFLTLAYQPQEDGSPSRDEMGSPLARMVVAQSFGSEGCKHQGELCIIKHARCALVHPLHKILMSTNTRLVAFLYHPIVNGIDGVAHAKLFAEGKITPRCIG